jgi:hypothetical protein
MYPVCEIYGLKTEEKLSALKEGLAVLYKGISTNDDVSLVLVIFIKFCLVSNTVEITVLSNVIV